MVQLLIAVVVPGAFCGRGWRSWQCWFAQTCLQCSVKRWRCNSEGMAVCDCVICIVNTRAVHITVIFICGFVKIYVYICGCLFG